jgi:hypothetical protein
LPPGRRSTFSSSTARNERRHHRDLKLGEALDLYNTPTIFIRELKAAGLSGKIPEFRPPTLTEISCRKTIFMKFSG